jgi:hypothetical protein
MEVTMDLRQAIKRMARVKQARANQTDEHARSSHARERGRALAKQAFADNDLSGITGTLVKQSSFWKDVAKNMAGMAGAAAMVGVANAGISAVEGALSGINEGRDKSKAFQEMMAVNKKSLEGDPKDKVMRAFDTLWRVNPEMARDPLVAGSFVSGIGEYGTVGIDKVKDMVAIRQALGQAKSRESIGGFSLPGMSAPKVGD